MTCKDCGEEITILAYETRQVEYLTDRQGDIILGTGRVTKGNVEDWPSDENYVTYCGCDEGDPEACPYEYHRGSLVRQAG